MQFHTRDWLDNKELRRCSPAARGVLADLMSLAHEGEPYGYIADKFGPLAEEFIAARCFITVEEFRKAVHELIKFERVSRENDTFYIKRMVEDERIRLARVNAGKSGGNPNVKGKPVKPVVNLPVNPEAQQDSALAGKPPSDSDSVSEEESKSEKVKEFPKPEEPDYSVIFESVYAAHPWKINRGLAENYFIQTAVAEGFDLAKFCKSHSDWCEYWKRDKFAKRVELAQFLLDHTWKYPPPGSEPEAARPINPAHVPWVDPYAHLKGITDGTETA